MNCGIIRRADRIEDNVHSIAINQHPIGRGHPPYVIAELSANHNGSLERALRLVEVAAEAGADAVKLQTYRADTMTIDSGAPEFQITGGLWGGQSLYELYAAAHMPWSWHAPLFARARELGLAAFSSPFDASAVDYLERLEVPAYKIASFELVDVALIRRAAATGKPLILSTGAADLGEIEEAVAAARDAGCRELALLHCVSAYPAAADNYRLGVIADMARRFDVPAGLSDHTPDNATAVAAAALGANIIEKHFTLNRADGGPDDSFSVEPDDLKKLCRDAKAAWASAGRIGYGAGAGERDARQFRRSLYVVKDVRAGETLTTDNVRSIRPGHGLAPKYLEQVLGKSAARNLARGTPLSWRLIV